MISVFEVSLSTQQNEAVHECHCAPCMSAEMILCADPNCRADAVPSLLVNTTVVCSSHKDTHQGIYRFNFLVHTKGTYRANVLYNEKLLSGNGTCLLEPAEGPERCPGTWIVPVNAGAASLDNSRINCSMCENGTALVDFQYEFVAVIRDAYGNSPPCNNGEKLTQCMLAL